MIFPVLRSPYFNTGRSPQLMGQQSKHTDKYFYIFE